MALGVGVGPHEQVVLFLGYLDYQVQISTFEIGIEFELAGQVRIHALEGALPSSLVQSELLQLFLQFRRHFVVFEPVLDGVAVLREGVELVGVLMAGPCITNPLPIYSSLFMKPV